MIMLHDSAHERLLERLAAGDPVARDERELLRACPDCERIEREMDTLQARLKRVGDRRRDVLEAARAAPNLADGRARLANLLRTHKPAPARRLGPTVVVVAAAIAAGLALWLWVGGERSQPPAPDPGLGFMLGSFGVEAVAPLGEVEAYGPFQFRTKARRGYYTVQIHAAGKPADDPLLTSTELEAGPELLEWRLTLAQEAALPDSIRYRVTWDPADGSPAESSAYFSASRSSR